jgi:hypothetical protein
MKTSIRFTHARAIFGAAVLTMGACGSVFGDTSEPSPGAGIEIQTAPVPPAHDTACTTRACRSRTRASNGPSDGRTGGTPETSARTPGGPPDDVSAGLTLALPSMSKDWL